LNFLAEVPEKSAGEALPQKKKGEKRKIPFSQRNGKKKTCVLNWRFKPRGKKKRL